MGLFIPEGCRQQGICIEKNLNNSWLSHNGYRTVVSYIVHVILLINRITQTVVYIYDLDLKYKTTNNIPGSQTWLFFINVCHTCQPALWSWVSQIQKKKWR